MKPVKLIIEGINSFIEPQTLDFEAVGRGNLFCISGKTGAGKTTIFDSLLFALYGKISKGNLADIVNLSRMNARVVFDFTEGVDAYSVERTVKCRAEKDENGDPTDKRSATSDCTLYKNGAPVAKGGDDVTEYIKGIVGLEADEFKNVYLLEQGEYADFLKKTPAKQTEAVGKIFALMRFGEVQKLAGERQREKEREAETVGTRINDLGDVSQDKLQERKTALSALKAKTTVLKNDEKTKRDELSTLEKVRDEFISVREKQRNVQSLMVRADEAKKACAMAQAELKEYESSLDTSAEQTLKGLRDRLNELSALASLDSEYAAAERNAADKKFECEKKRATVAEQTEKHAALEKKRNEDSENFAQLRKCFVERVAQLPEKSNALVNAATSVGAESAGVTQVTDAQYLINQESESYAQLTALRAQRDTERQKKRAACADLLNIIERYGAELKVLDTEYATAVDAEKRAAAELASAQLCSHAAAVRAELHDGDICPVCGGRYSGGTGDGDTDVEKHKAEHDRAVAALKVVAEKRDDRNKHLDRAKSDYDRESAEVKRLDGEIAEADRKINDTHVVPSVYRELSEVLAKARAAGEKAASSEQMLNVHAPIVSAAQAEYTAAESAAAEAEKRSEEYKQRLGDNCGKTAQAISQLNEQISSVEKSIAEAENKRKELVGKADAANATVQTIENALSAARADCPVDIPPFDEEKYTEKRDMLDALVKHIAENDKEIAVREVELASLEDACKKLEALAAERKGLDKSAAIYAEIARVTKSKEMLNYVVAEYIAEFTAAASDILNELSDGKYTMSYDSASGFMVTDYLNGGKSRKTDTLSGGELFLASLSVAIAIARTQSRGNNAFFFLDEGFGTLDEELIDTVYGALESLSADCLVGVISHAAALIERMPACVEVLEATDTTGSIIKY